MNLEEFRVTYQNKEQLGLNKKQFCDQYNIKLHVYNYWLRKLRDESHEDSPFIEINSPIPKSDILVKLSNGISIEVPENYNENHLLKLVGTLIRC